MGVTRDEAAPAAATRGEVQARNPIPNDNANPNPNPIANPNPRTRGAKGKSCKGVAYYSSVRKSKSKNPSCVGFTSTLDQVPPYVVGEAELEASKEGRSFRNFKYACVGYSVYQDEKDSSSNSQDKTAKLPFCVGLEVVLEEKSSSIPARSAPAPAHKPEEHEHATPQPQPQPQPLPQPQPRKYKPPNTTAEEFLTKFQKNAGLVASGVVKNLNRVSNFVKDTVKETVDDILNRRPK